MVFLEIFSCAVSVSTENFRSSRRRFSMEARIILSRMMETKPPVFVSVLLPGVSCVKEQTVNFRLRRRAARGEDGIVSRKTGILRETMASDGVGLWN